MSTQARVHILAQGPPPVSGFIRSLCGPWMFYRRAVLRPRLSRAVIERVRKRDFIVWPGVFNPVIFRTGRFLAEFVAGTPLIGARSETEQALDVGTGCGILAVFAATRGYRVTAVDIEERAV